LVVIATLTLAVGATAAVGSLLKALVLRTLTVASPGQLAALSAFAAYRASQRSFAQISTHAGGAILRVFITSSQWVDGALLQERFTAGLATFAAALTVLLACVGMYGLLAYSVAARTREIGVRVALGATRGTVVWITCATGWQLWCPGCSLALSARGLLHGLVRAPLYGVGPGDPRTLVAAAAILLAAVLASSWFPALCAAKVAPIEALRHE
jgi:hypothetical protein